jgi:Ran GTPase-activating protein (RanGAP) involved in mRNA processing and transport
MNNFQMYETKADTIDVDDIAANNNNRIVMRRIKANNEQDVYEKNELYIQHEHDKDGEDCVDYVPGGAVDMGWMGYFIGKSEYLEELIMSYFIPTSGESVEDVLKPFFRGVNNNKSIQKIDFTKANLLGGKVFDIMNPFFKDNHNLTGISIGQCHFDSLESHFLALAIRSCTHKSLQTVILQDNNIADEGMVDIITALSMHPNLVYLDLEANRLGYNSCVALATLLQSSVTELQRLDLSHNQINDEGIEALLPALTNCNHFKGLTLGNNPSITTRGWKSLATVLRSPCSNLEVLLE